MSVGCLEVFRRAPAQPQTREDGVYCFCCGATVKAQEAFKGFAQRYPKGAVSIPNGRLGPLHQEIEDSRSSSSSPVSELIGI